MEYINKLNEFGNYLISINNDESKKLFINVVFINCKYDEALNTIKFVKPEVEDYSQLNEWISVYSLVDNEENRLKLKEYQDYFLSVQEYINV